MSKPVVKVVSVLVLAAGLVAVALIATGSTGGSTSVAAPAANLADGGPSAPATGTHASPIVHVPASLPPGKVPLVIALHGSGSSPAGAETTTGFDRLADRYGFVVAYLGSGSPGGTWKSPADTTYVSGEITALEHNYPIDPRRVFVTGFSAGGYEAYRSGCLLSAQVAAVAPVGVTMNGVLYHTCRPRRPVSALIIIGTADLQHYGGSVRLPSAPAAAALWRGIDGCPASLAARQSTVGPTSQQLWSGCADHSAVGLYQIQGGYHIWPSPGLNNGTPDSRYDGATAVWQFFSGLSAGSLTRPDVTRVAVVAGGLGARRGAKPTRRLSATVTAGEPITVTVTVSARGKRLVRRTRRMSAGATTLALTVPARPHATRYNLRMVIVDRYGRSETVTRTLSLG